MAKLKDGFYKQTAEAIGSNQHILLAGGGSKPISDFATTSSLADYLKVGTAGYNVGYRRLIKINDTDYSVLGCASGNLPTIYTHTTKGSDQLSYSDGSNVLKYTNIKYLKFDMPDNKGYDAYLLIADLSNWLSGTNSDTYIIGTIYGQRGGNQSLTGVYNIIAQCSSYSSGTTYKLYTSEYSERTILPYIVEYNGTKYLALKKRSSGASIYFIGLASNILSSPIIVNAPQTSSGAIPDGMTILRSPTYDKFQVAATKLYDGVGSYNILHSGNSSVSGGGSSWGSSITVKINNTTATLTIPANPNTHWTTRIYAGASGTATNAAATNPYLKVTDDNNYRNQVRFIGSGATTVSSDASGNITISSTNTTYSTKGFSVNGTGYNIYTPDSNLPIIYAPTGAGTSGLLLKSNGSGAPTWIALSSITAGNSDMIDGYHVSNFGHYAYKLTLLDTTNVEWYIKVVFNANYNSSSHFIYCSPSYNNISGRMMLEIPSYTNSLGYIAKISNYNGCNIKGFYYDRVDDKVTLYLKLAGYSSATCSLYSTLEITSATVISNPSVSFISTSGRLIITNYTFVGTATIANKVANALTFAAGTFSALTYDGSAAKTVNIPTHTSHLTNNSGFLTSRGYIGTTAVLAGSANQALTGISSIFINTGDPTLKIYSGRITDVQSDGNICFLTSIDGTDGESSTYPINYKSRCNIVLQPRGGLVYIGTNPDGGNAAYKLYVNGAIYGTTFSGSAGSLTIARTIGITGGIKGTATSFNGTANISIPVTEIYESYLKWGNTSISGDITPVDNGMNDFGVNRLSFMNADDINIEYSNDSGATWNTASYSDTDKQSLVTSFKGKSIGMGNKSTNLLIADMLRVTITATSGSLYFRLKKILILISQGGATGCKVTLEKALCGSDTVFNTINTYNISGWSGWNSIPLEETFGGSATRNVRRIRFTFYFTGISSGYETKTTMIIHSIHMYGSISWSSPSTMSNTGHLYDFNINKKATFPNTISSTGFIKSGSSDSYVLLGGGSHKALSDFVTSSTLNNYVTLNTALTISATKTFSAQQKFTVADGTAPFTVTSKTKVANLNADLLDGYDETNFFRYRQSIATSYVDITTYTSGAADFIKSLASGVYKVDRSDSSELFIHFLGAGSTTGLEIKTNYPHTDRLEIRKTIDNNRVSGIWKELAWYSDIPTKTSQLTNDSGFITLGDLNADTVDTYHISVGSTAGTDSKTIYFVI